MEVIGQVRMAWLKHNLPIGRGAKVKHCCDTDHDSSGNRIDIEPETDKRTRDQNHARNEDGAEVKGLVASEDEVNGEAAELISPGVPDPAVSRRILNQVGIEGPQRAGLHDG